MVLSGKQIAEHIADISRSVSKRIHETQESAKAAYPEEVARGESDYRAGVKYKSSLIPDDRWTPKEVAYNCGYMAAEWEDMVRNWKRRRK